MGLAAKDSGRSPLPLHCAPPLAPDCGVPPALDEMVRRINDINPRSGADALRELRLAFPDSPLTLRVAALDALLRQRGH